MTEIAHIGTIPKEPLVVGGVTFYAATDYNLTEKEFEKAREELNETEENRKMCLQKLKEKLSDDDDTTYLMDDGYLLRYLRFKKFDCDKTFKMMKDLYSHLKKNPEVFIRPNLESLLNKYIFYFLPYTDGEGKVIFISDFEHWKTDEVSYNELRQIMIAVMEVVTLNPRCQVNGAISIWDMKCLNLSHISEILSLRRVILFFQGFQCNPCRIKLVIGVNSNRLARIGYRFILPFLKKKLAERVILLGSDLSELHQYVNPALLPKKFGGTFEEEQCSITQYIIDHLPFLKQLFNQL